MQAKSWAASGAEPGTWDIDTTVTRTVSGYLGFTVRPDVAAANYTATYDDITIT